MTLPGKLASVQENVEWLAAQIAWVGISGMTVRYFPKLAHADAWIVRSATELGSRLVEPDCYIVTHDEFPRFPGGNSAFTNYGGMVLRRDEAGVREHLREHWAFAVTNAAHCAIYVPLDPEAEFDALARELE